MAYCPNCGEQSNGTSKFCKKCGAPMTAQETADKQPTAAEEAPKITESRPATPVGQTISGIHVSSKFVKWPSNLINISYIERISTTIPKAPFPKLALLLLLVGIALFFFMLPLGIIVLIAAIAWIVFWAYKNLTAPKGISFYLNSGRVISIFLSDHSVVDGIASSVRRAIDGEKVEYHVEMKNVKTNDLMSRLNLFGD